MSNAYESPGAPGGDKLPLGDLEGALIRVDVVEALTGVTTSFGVSDPIRCNVAALDGALKAQTWDDTLVFPKVLASQLRGSVGKVVLGRLGRGTAKPGQSAPWLLSAPTGEDIAVAQKYDAYVASKTPVDTSAPF
jgi:hypothetical protein